MRKMILGVWVSAAAALTLIAGAAGAEGASALRPSVEWNGTALKHGEFYIDNGTTMVGLERIGSLQGLSARWMADEGVVRLWVDRGGVFDFKPGSSFAETDGKRYPLISPVALKDGQPMLPMRFIAEMAGAEVLWDASGKTAKLNQTETAIASIPGTANRLYAESEESGLFKGVRLEWNGTSRSFPWTNPSDISDPPQLFGADLDGDGHNEAIILLNAGSGTGVYLEEPHVIRADDFTEIFVEDPLDFIKRELRSTVTVNENGGVVITVEAGGQTVTAKRSAEDYGNGGRDLGKALSFGNIVDYEVNGGQLAVKVPGLAGVADFVGEAEVEYAYVDGQLKGSAVVFSVYE